MIRAARRYAPFALAGLHAVTRYRSTIVLSALTAAAATSLQVFLWRAVYAGGPAPAGLPFAQLTSYIVLAQVLGMLHTNRIDEMIAGEVYRGDIAVSLVRPANYALSCLAVNLPTAALSALLAGAPVLAGFAMFASLPAPPPANLLLFAVALLLSVILAFEINFLVGLAAFVTTNTWGIRTIKNALVAFLAGQVVPLALFPDGVARLLRLLPFQGLIDSPLRLLLGGYSGGSGAAAILGVQALWAVLLYGVLALAWNRSLRRVEVLGG
ncbi:ABC transporter permease [Actinoplanes sp. SE50]|uniref:ABC transporter permease n=1 Tax=unclassified Actinoplanes TaxID=2626549 RepID=UPI00006CA2CE|nr:MULTISPECIES: ABC-2 family transporter protein [unclassified Actinoplanes]AEV84560.1 ABC transporter permease protein [Actinoplanes sp. SE50/110]ATO82952.1 ABC transporter permease [Actinoplanes sp. SE50]CAJ81020.1 ABC transporter permease protein AcbX [Actinoplanes sp. SE50/110]SLM00360.1 ABC-type transporter, permease component [Actinoplanes sp. SE50/110]